MADNPFRSEARAYRFLLLTVGYFALIVIARSIATWLGVAVFAVLTALALWAWLRSRSPDSAPPGPIAPRSGEGKRHILVVANETVGGAELLAAVRAKTKEGSAELRVVCPALNSQVRTWTSDEDGARAAAARRLALSLDQLRRDGVQATGEVGDADPLQAIEDALRTFGADEIVISTHPVGRSNWLERDVVVLARERFDVPIVHVVVDLGAESP